MKLLTYALKNETKQKVGFVSGEWIVDIHLAGVWLMEQGKESDSYLNIPSSMKEILADWKTNLDQIREFEQKLSSEDCSEISVNGTAVAVRESEIRFLPPVPEPPTFRDFYAFEQHVKAARKSRGLDMHPTWYEIPVFYFSNPYCMVGHKEDVKLPAGSDALDFELELGIIIANGGSDISSENAEKYIAGYTIINDWSARDLQKQEMVLNMGPVKGKDFATTTGPYLVTPDELADKWNDGKLEIEMKAWKNEKQLSHGNTDDLYHSWGKIIERASKNTRLMPGDLIGSGTVGTGCILELKPENTDGWVQNGDTIKLEIERLGVLENKIV
jgi:fumarylacetoacetate (FAA) hydrolase|tara:strand:- start:458 stop:1444 length:987 start_codon:yes stop_codon:yes gene_type:complete